MHKDILTLLEKHDAASDHKIMPGHARLLRHAPDTGAGKNAPLSQTRSVLLAAGAGCAAGMEAACVAALVKAGHRIVKVPHGDGLPSGPGSADADTGADTGADTCLISLPVPASNPAGMQRAIRSLPAQFRCVDAVVSILPRPLQHTGLLGDNAALVDPGLAAATNHLREATRAALPFLLASKRGQVIVVALGLDPQQPGAGQGEADALCVALGSELDDLGIRFTRISAGPVESRAEPGRHAGNRPRSNGLPRGLLSAGDVAEAVAWTLAQPGHLAVRDICLTPAPRARPVLSPREREVLEWTACGKTSEEISCILELSVSAVNFHVKNLLSKLDCCNKTAAVARAALLGLLH